MVDMPTDTKWTKDALCLTKWFAQCGLHAWEEVLPIVILDVPANEIIGVERRACLVVAVDRVGQTQMERARAEHSTGGFVFGTTMGVWVVVAQLPFPVNVFGSAAQGLAQWRVGGEDTGNGDCLTL
jgi:hypothetical protein